MFWLLVIIVLIAVVFWYKCVRPLNYFKERGVKESGTSWPILGDQWMIIFKRKSFADMLITIYSAHDKCRYVGFSQFGNPTIVLRDPELIKQITVKDFDYFTDHIFFVDPEREPLWARNLFALKGQHWREMRATLSGAFTSSKMKHMFDVINETAESFTEFFLKQNRDSIELEMKSTFSRYTNDVIASAAFGIKVNSLDEPENNFYLMGKKITDLTGVKTIVKFAMFFLMPKICRFFNLSIFDTNLSKYFRNIIHETIKMREEKGIVRKDMLNLMIETRKGGKTVEGDVAEAGFATVKDSTYFDKYKFKQQKTLLSNDDITSQALIFFFAGFETISTALSFGSYELALNPDIQERLVKEIRETHQKLDNGKLTYNALMEMKYLDMVFSEVLRKWSPLATIDRVCTKPYTIEPVYPDEVAYHVKVGDVLMLPMFPSHRNPKYFPDPERFDPERFSDENKHNIKPFTYIPFGAGPRACIGSRFAIMEAKALLYHLLLNFKIVPCDKTCIPPVLSKNNLQVMVEGGFWLGLEKVQ